MSFGFTTSGSFDRTERHLKRLAQNDIFQSLDKYGRAGAAALAKATPRNDGSTGESWAYEIKRTPSRVTITWYNDDKSEPVNVALLIQYGHGTRNGGYVTGIDFVNPAMRPIFADIATEVWKEVTKHG